MFLVEIEIDVKSKPFLFFLFDDRK